jgi:hypothetical protein
MKTTYDDLIDFYKSDYFKALEKIKASLSMGSNIDDLELISFDLVSIDELFESCYEQSDRQLFYNTESLEKIILFRQPNCPIYYNAMSDFIKSHFSFIKDKEHSLCTEEIIDWRWSSPLENIGLVFTFYTPSDNIFFVVVPFKSLVEGVLVA